MFMAPPASSATLAAPSGVSVVVASSNVAFEQGRVAVTWSAVGGALGYAVTARSGGVAVSTTTVASPVTSGTLTGLRGGITYDIVVQTANSNGFGNASTPVQATALTVPAAPAIGTPSESGGNTIVTWSEPNNGGSAITSYSITQVATGLQVSDISGTSHTFTGTTYLNASDYTVTATNSVGVSTVSEATSNVPSAPRSLSATAVSGVITATWTAPLTNGGSAVSSYSATLLASGSVVSFQASGITSATFPSVSAGTYSIQVAALNANGAGVPATISIVVAASGGGSSGGGGFSGGDTSPDASNPGTATAPGGSTGANAPGSGSQGTVSTQPSARPSATLAASVVAVPGKRKQVTLKNVKNVNPRLLSLRLTVKGKKAQQVKAKFVRKGPNVTFRFTAPKKTGKYRMQVMQRTATGFVQVSSTSLTVKRA